MLVITGATGNIGSKLANILLDRGEKVRVVGRNAERLARFAERGAEVATGNLKDTAFLTKAFTGATAVFAMIPPDHTVKDFRAYQNEIGASIATAITNSGVSHVVNLSSQGADLPAGTGPIVGLRDQEERLNMLAGVNIIHLRCTYFMENLLMNIPTINRTGVAGSAIRGDRKFAMIATRDIAGRVADLLTAHDFIGISIRDLLGQRDVSMEEAFRVFGRKIGWPELRYIQFSSDDAARGLREMGVSADLSRLFVEMSEALNDGLFAVNRLRTFENTTATSIEDFAVTFAEAFYAAATAREAV